MGRVPAISGQKNQSLKLHPFTEVLFLLYACSWLSKCSAFKLVGR